MTKEERWIELITVSYPAEAEIIRGLLAAHEIECRFSPRFIYPLTVGKLGETKIFVRRHDYCPARQILFPWSREE